MGNQPGKYQQQNQSGKPKKAVHWKSAEPPSPPGRPILTALSEQQPDVINLRWERPKLDGGSQITGYIVEHRRMGSPHWVRATPTPVTACEVSISGLEPGWRYQFRTFAENVVGRSEPSELSDMLTVTLQRNAISVPRFIDELQDTQAVEDERIEFRVRIQGQPIPEVSWYKDGYEIFSSRRTKIVNDNDASVLIIHQVALTDEGEIKCSATNRAGHVMTKCQLMVEAPPKIRLPRTYEDGIIVEADEVLRLKVGVAGQPMPSVTWLHEGEPIKSDGRFEIVNTDKNSMLKIDNIQRDDRGEYSIRASNRLGDDVTSFLVTVTARPDPPGKVRLNMSFGKSATLSWTAPVDDGGCKIGNYIVEYFRIGWNVWLKASTTRSLCTTLNDLIEGSEYKFRVKAENPYGLSDPSEESDVLFIPDPKRGINKPKSEAKLAEVQPSSKTTPPRRKTLSPLRPQQQDASTETPKRLSPSAKRKAERPQLVDNEELHLEMSYGMTDKMLMSEVRKSPSMSSADSAAPKAKPKLTLKIEKSIPAPKSPTRTPTAESPKLGLRLEEPQSPKKSPSRSPTIEMTSHVFHKVAEKGASIAQALLKPSLATPERSLTPEINTEPQSPPPSLKPNAPLPLRKSPTPPEPIKNTPALQRSTEPVQLGVNQTVRRYSGTLMSAKEAPKLAIAIAMGNIGSSNNNNKNVNNNTIGQINKNENKNGINIGTEQDITSQKQNNNNWALHDTESPSKFGEITSRKIDNNNEVRYKNPNNNNTVSNNNGKNPGNNNTVSNKNDNNPSNNNPNNNKNNINNNNGKNNVSTITNPTIQISAPPVITIASTITNVATPAINLTPSPPFSPLSASDRHDDVHTSNEFMVVVFDKNSKVKDKSKQDSFELDLEDALQPPPISISSPDLASLEYNNLHSFPLRRSVSSTELLYERAMARFYEAVELEEAEKARKLKISQDKIATPSNAQTATTRKRLGAMTEAERLSFEKRSEIRRQSTEFGHDFKVPTKWSSRENVADAKPLSRPKGVMIPQESQESQEEESPESDELHDFQTRSAPQQADSFELGSDYTESTASSDEDSMEKFKMDLMARTKSPSPHDLDTYHPRNMSAGVFTPYRAPTPEQSVVVLNRPLPLPSPDFVPKPILKRSSIENIIVNEDKPPSPNPGNENKPLDLAKSLKSFFTRDKKTTTEKNTEENEKISNLSPKEKANAALKHAENEINRIVKEDEERKRQEAVLTMQEESMVAVDHYSDIVRQVGSTHKYHTPLYLDRDELKKAAAKAALEGDDDDTDGMAEHLKMREPKETEMLSLAPPQPVRRLSISERGQMIHVRETASDLAMIEQKAAVKIPDTPSEDSSTAPTFIPIPPQYAMTAAKPKPPLSPPLSRPLSPPLSRPQLRPLSPPAVEVALPSPVTTDTVISETLEERPDSRGRTRLVKVKRIVKKRVVSSSREPSIGSRQASSAASTQEISPYIRRPTENVVGRRVASATRSAVGAYGGESKSPGALLRRPLNVPEQKMPALPAAESKLFLTLSNGQLLEIKSADQMSEEAHEKVRSALSYSADLVLFVVACYVYLFKDAWMVLPILALMIYRQLGEVLEAHIPKWMRRKKEDPS